MKLIDITGQRYGRLVVVAKLAPSKSGGSMWDCVCDCGNRKSANSSNLRSGQTASCGCLAIEWAKKMGANETFIAKRAEKQVRHGCKTRLGASPEYKTWLGMKRRCYSPKCKNFPGWGGRGIAVDEPWRSSFEAFLRDMGQKPSPLHSIDRINSNGNYNANNCRWATPQQQGSENRRNLTQVEVDGMIFKSIGAACRHFGVNLTTAHNRISAGIQIEKAVSDVSRLKPRRSRESYLRKDRRP